MADEERAGTWKLRGQAPLLAAEITVDPKVAKVEGDDPYLVYELRESTTEPAEAPLAQLGASSPAAVRFSPEEVGCFFAKSPEQACKHAARFLGKLGHFVAVKGTHVPLDFREDDPPGAAAATSAGKTPPGNAPSGPGQPPSGKAAGAKARTGAASTRGGGAAAAGSRRAAAGRGRRSP
jgi:hypothetical protein